MVKVDKRNISLVVLLVVLVVIAVGLAVAIVFLNRPGDMAPVADETSYTEETYDEVENRATKIYDESSDKQKVIDYYNTIIDYHAKKGNYDLVAKILVARSNFFSLRDDCELALQLADNISYDTLSPEQKGYIYSRLVGLGIDCNEQTFSNKYSDLLAQNSQEITHALGF